MRTATADIAPVSIESRKPWLRDHPPAKYPIYVAQNHAQITGWCSLSPYRAGREALRHTTEISYYVHNDFRRQGIGSALIAHAIQDCHRLEIKSLFAILLDINPASLKVLEKLGFEKWGHMPNIADFDGRECGHLYYGLRIK
jgi:L-amino acid N-acyltransferase YncA